MRVTALARGVLDRGREAEIAFLAAAIAYYAFVSVLPGLLLAFAVATAVGGDPLTERVLGASRAYLTPTGQDLLAGATRDATGRLGASALGLVVLLWSSLRVFRGLDLAFSRVYGTSQAAGLLDQLRDAGVVFGAVVLGLWGWLAVGAALTAVDLGPVAGAVGLAVLLAGLFVVFLPLFYVFPDADLSVTAAAPGTALAAGGWILLLAAFQGYAAIAPAYQLYGVIGGVLLLVTWFYAGALLLLLGATTNVVLEGRNRH